MGLESFSEYAKYLEAGGRAHSTTRLRLRHLTAAARAIGDLDSARAEDIISYLSSGEWSPATRRSQRASLCGYFSWLQATGRRVDNPAVNLPRVIQPRSLPRPAADSDILAALRSAPPRVQTMIELMAYAGLRRMEVAKLHSRDVITTTTAAALRIVGKGGHARIIPIPRYLGLRLAQQRGFIFPGDIDGHLSAAYVGKLVSKYLPPGVTGHMIRHRYATECYRRGRDIRAVQELLGHARLDTTMIYTRVDSTEIASAARTTWTLTA